MPAPPSQAQPAYFQECHSDDGEEVLGDKVVARRTQRAASRTPVIVDRRREPTPSDSGYSSHTSGTKTVKPADPLVSQAMVRQGQLPSSGTSKSGAKAVIHRHDSGRVPSVKSPSPYCSDPHCRDPTCSGMPPSIAERRQSMSQAPQRAPPPQQQLPPPPPQQQQPRSIPYHPSALDHYQQQAHIQQSYYHPYHTMPNVPMPPPAVPQPIPRPRAGSSNRPRPVSLHGYPMQSSYAASYDDSQRGPPPSASAYYSNAPVGYPSQAGEYPASTPPDPTSAAYAPYSPGLASPTSPSSMAGAAGYLGAGTNMYSARRGTPGVTGLVVPKVTAPVLPTRSLSARRSEPVRAPAPQIEEPDSSEHSSEPDDSASDDEDYEDMGKAIVKRSNEPLSLRKEMVLRRRRPSLGRGYHTTANVIQDPRPQEPLHRAPFSDSDFNYYSSSDYVDSDRTTRAILPAKETGSSRSSRRPSVSTNASSGRTKATTVSSMSDYSRVIIEDKNGRRTKYLSGDQVEQLKRIKSLKRREKIDDLDEKERAAIKMEEATAYQRLTSGGGSFELTAENIRKSQNRKSGSHISGARTHKSSHSGSKTSRVDGGIRIESGGTVLHVYGDAQIEMRRDEEGGPAHLIVNGGRDSGYNTSSRSTDSRHGRSRIGSEMGRTHRYKRQPIYEEVNEGGYERNL